MAVTIDNLISIPNLPSAGALADTDLLHVNQADVDGKLSLLALTTYMMDKAHPIGEIFLNSKKGVNPNLVYPGQTWVRLPGTSRQLRICLEDESNLGNQAGSDTITITAANLPAHTHTFSATTGGGGAHTPGGTIAANGAHTHSVSGSAASSGVHNHDFNYTMTNTNNGHYGDNGYGGTRTTLSGTTANDGAHTHTVSGTAASAGSHAHTFTGAAVAAHTHTVSGTTGSAFSAAPSAIIVSGAYVYVAAWTRTV